MSSKEMLEVESPRILGFEEVLLLEENLSQADQKFLKLTGNCMNIIVIYVKQSGVGYCQDKFPTSRF